LLLISCFWWFFINWVKIMNWWVIVVEICLNSLHECLFMFICWRSLNLCGCLWSLNEKWENCGFWWKMNIMMVLVKIDAMMPCLLLFWLSFEVCKQMYKFWEQILVKEDQKRRFCGELHSTEPRVLGCCGCFEANPDSPN